MENGGLNRFAKKMENVGKIRFAKKGKIENGGKISMEIKQLIN